MKILKNQELESTVGGMNATWFTIITLGITFISSVIYGYVYPTKCSR